MTDRVVFVRALGVAFGIGLLGAQALAGFEAADSSLELRQMTFAEIGGGGAYDEQSQESDTAFQVDQDAQGGPYAVRKRGLLESEVGSARARLSTDAWSSLALDRAEMRFSAEGEADGDEDGFAFADLAAFYELRFRAERDTQLHISMLLDIEASGDAVENAFIRLDGFPSAFELRYDHTGAYTAELELTVTVQAGSSYQLTAGMDASPDSRRGGSFRGEMAVDVTLAPAPGTAALLALGGVLGVRRRR